MRLALAFLLLGFHGIARADFEVVQADPRFASRQVQTQIEFKLDLSDKVENALINGITLVFQIDLSLQRIRPIIWNERIARKRHLVYLQYHALTSRYIVSEKGKTNNESFNTSDDALKFISDLGPYIIPLPDDYDVSAEEQYTLAARIKLDIESLPVPLRPLAYLTPSWRLSSTWKQWPIKN